ncbi:MAG: outer rane efflux protein [Planctomycetaceae bacterium]|nr:outer rane efflux protein [Planctomycetaceae bacterium]
MRSGIRPRRSQFHLQLMCWLGIVSLTLTGCLTTKVGKVSYIGNKPLSDRLDQSMHIAHPSIDNDLGDIRAYPARPRTVLERIDSNQVWDIHLAEAIQLALTNNKIVRANDRSTIGGNSSRLLTSPDSLNSVYDPAIQETGVLFGARGVESALSAFDAQLTSSLSTGNTQLVQNNIFNGAGLPAGSTLVSDVGQLQTSIQKQYATGATATVSHEVDYLQNNIPTALFPSNWTGNIAANIRQPLLAGSGVNFTRIAGPVGQNIQGLSGVNQGVVIARINNDISIADFEFSVNNMVFDVEKLYWDLYFAYRRYASAVTNREAGEKTWQDAHVKFTLGAEGGDGFLEAQARDAYYDRVATEESSLALIDTLEGSLRRICGLPLNDGRILRPADDPITARFKPDWNSDLAMALTRRVELRRQKWNIKSTELQLDAAKSFTNPRLDLIGSYQLNGFGDRLMSSRTADGTTQEGFHNFYDALLRGHQTSYNIGAQFSMPFGFRAANAQVRNLELRLAKARQVLRGQEDDVIFELALAYQDLASNWANAQTYFNRKIAAEEQARFIEQQRLQGKKEATLRDQLEAQAHQAQAETSYYQSIIEYTKAIAHVNYRKGALLELNNIFLSEGTWDPKAYEDALARAWERTYSLKHPGEKRMTTQPEPFSNPGDPGTSTYFIDPNAQTTPTELYEDPNAPALTEPNAAPGVDVPEATPEQDALPNPDNVRNPDEAPEGPVADKPGAQRG